MGNVVDLLMNKKYYESIDEVEKYLLEQDAEKGAVVQTLIFDKKIFPTETDASTWSREHGFTSVKVDEKKDTWHLVQLDPSEFVDNSFRTIDITTGVKAIIGTLKQDPQASDSMSYLSLRNHDDSIVFSDTLPHIIELIKVVKGYHPQYGEVEVTKEMILNFKDNFNKKVIGVDLMIDYDHGQAEAAGWIKSVYISLDGATLFGEVKWTPKGAQCLSEKSFRYFSPEFVRSYTHPHTGVNHGATLIGGGLVNRPFLKMDAIVSMKEKQLGDLTMTIKLTEHKDIVSKFEVQLGELKLSEDNAKKIIAGLKSETLLLSEKVKLLETEKTEKERIQKNELLFSENKINKAQLDALNSGKDLYEILKLSENMNIDGKGKSSKEGSVSLSESEEKACNVLGISKEDFVKYNK